MLGSARCNRRDYVTDLEEVDAAEARMNAAREALLKYVEQREQLDGEQYRRLAARVKKAEAEFMSVVAKA
jgi:hypothetical protein